MNRREFIRLGLMVSAAGLLSSCQAETSEKATGTRIIVIGAGMAGLTAAKKLQMMGYRPLVLEGRDRLGGRTWTSDFWPDAPVDMGASWIHGDDNNPLTELADEAEAERIVTNYEDNALIFDADGSWLDDDEAAELVTEGEAVLARAIITAKASILSDDYSIEEAAADAAELETWSDEERRYFNFILSAFVEQEAAGDAADVSAKYAIDVGAFSGDEVIFRNGYVELVNHLAQGLDIRLEQTVTGISHDDTGVKVSTTDGTFEADYVIVTVPLGVLKRGRIAFDPPLPTTKQDAIQASQMGVLNKTYLRFAEPFWDEDAGAFFYIPEQKGEWTFWVNMWPYIQKPILIGFNAAAYGTAIETLPDGEIVAAGMQTLRTIYGNDIPEPESWQITRWASDPFAYGSYSYTAVGTSEETRATLAEPVNGRLFFAGEATAETYPSTVHGAHLSGLRAAEELLDTV